MPSPSAGNPKNSMPSGSGGLVGRADEFRRIQACLTARRNVLLEGPVGVGKTRLALAVTGSLKRPVFRIDGDNRYSEQKLTGWFDPPTVIKKGYSTESFIPGPLAEAMKVGGVLFINELNRLPEGVQNVLLPAIDERLISVPRLGEIKAKPGFLVIATQNPKEFVATSHLSEAILDRFELVVLDYQGEQEELAIVLPGIEPHGLKQAGNALARAAVRIARVTRDHPRVRRGASVRAAMSIGELAAVLLKSGASFRDAFLEAVLMALPTRIEIEREADSNQSAHAEAEALIKEWAEKVLGELESPEDDAGKKKR